MGFFSPALLAWLFISISFISSAAANTVAKSPSVTILSTTTLGPDPQTVNRLNGESFQQDALTSFNGYQYAVFWMADTGNASVRHACVSRRALSGQGSVNGNDTAGEWDTLMLMDYEQVDDDGHDIISLGISHGDGTLHLSFDQHDNPLNYRVSVPGVATAPGNITWGPAIFGPVLNYLPGLESLDPNVYFINITYPRFLVIPSYVPQPAPSADLLLEMRVGRSGLGDDWLYRYVPAQGWELTGRYLEGVNNNAYINGIDFDPKGNLQATWTYRDYVNDTGQDVAVEAGPNGPENNHDMDFATSPDLGFTWYNTWGQPICNTSAQQPILPNSPGITVFSIPKYGGILNQEAQIIDSAGRMHVLNRENTTGSELWYHYWRDMNNYWTRTAFPLNIPGDYNITGTPTVIGKRGKLIALPPALSSDELSSASNTENSQLLALLPSNAANSSALSLLRSTAAGGFVDWETVWEVESGCGWEPLFDRERLIGGGRTTSDAGAGTGDGVLSLYLVNGTQVVVTDLDISGLL
ncbi:hypothetical protein BJ138DRAFT_1152356 [Hygrophoropsis aurantiaca]|uniref:Uncharacterized protein n=1 Tax=Hygrophoropsis aurantiaca TaxID=72124 RepID=A0ACB8ABH3_9AGAM|nr:hypothetical protein BJ138DRAFT_1152356 [Hygrophoropsis aurantiaca]